jgi:hypothetical protein
VGLLKLADMQAEIVKVDKVMVSEETERRFN